MTTPFLPSPYATVAEFCAHSGLSEDSVLAWCKDARIPSLGLSGGDLRIVTADRHRIETILSAIRPVWEQRHPSKTEERRRRKSPQ